MTDRLGARAGADARKYLKVALFLTVVTLIEVAVPFIEVLRPVMVALLLALGAIKFIGVVAYFMHLKMDPRLLSWIFGVGMFVAVLLTVAMIVVMLA